MTRPTRRSNAARQRRYVNRLVSTNSYKDYGKQENVNTLTSEELEWRLIETFGDVRTGLHLQFERGEIIADSRGDGSLQQIRDEE